MQNSESRMNELFDGLKLLADSAFPKQCPGCSKVYAGLEQLLQETQPVDSPTGLKQPSDVALVALIRRCGCGAVIEEFCDDRRSQDALSIKRRELFERLLGLLLDSGMPETTAKQELLKVMKGENSELLTKEEIFRFFS